jgi:hypothetical protein
MKYRDAIFTTNPGEPYLDYPKNSIHEFLGDHPVTALFIPYVAVTLSSTFAQMNYLCSLISYRHQDISIKI